MKEIDLNDSGAKHRVAETQIGKIRVSTAFLKTDHNFATGGSSALFETRVFGGALDQERECYVDWEQAKAGHAYMVDRVIAGPLPAPAVLWVLISGLHFWQAAKFTFAHYVQGKDFTVKRGEITEVGLRERKDAL